MIEKESRIDMYMHMHPCIHYIPLRCVKIRYLHHIHTTYIYTYPPTLANLSEVRVWVNGCFSVVQDGDIGMQQRVLDQLKNGHFERVSLGGWSAVPLHFFPVIM